MPFAFCNFALLLMSSDISKLEKSRWDKWWIKLHQRTSHSTRVRQLARIFSGIMEDGKNVKVKCLDVGCGDMQIAELIAAANAKTIWTCLDIYPLPEDLKSQEKWQKYRSFDGQHIPTEDQSFDYVLLCDVLHHSLDPALVLRECARVGKKIIVKDHYQYGYFSNLILKWMDRFGNQAYGVHIPGKYFSVDGFSALCRKCGLEIVQQQAGIQLYGHLPVLRRVLRKEWQFWAVLENQDATSKLK